MIKQNANCVVGGASSTFGSEYEDGEDGCWIGGGSVVGGCNVGGVVVELDMLMTPKPLKPPEEGWVWYRFRRGGLWHLCQSLTDQGCATACGKYYHNPKRAEQRQSPTRDVCAPCYRVYLLSISQQSQQ